MAIIKTFSLCIALLSAFNLFTMEHELFAELGRVDVDVKAPSAQSVALNKVWDCIDVTYLGISHSIIKDGFYMVPLIGSFLSFYKGRQIQPKQAATQMNQIGSWIESAIEEDKSRCGIFNKLVEDHWYANYLMKAVVNENVHHLECVTGSSIDALWDEYNNVDVNKIQNIAVVAAYKKFFDDNLDKKKLTDIMPPIMSDIHFTVLYHPNKKDIKSDSLKISSDGKYLQAADKHNILKLEMETGKSLSIKNINLIEWIPGKFYADNSRAKKAVFGGYAYDFIERYKVIDQKDNYCAQVSGAYTIIDSEFFQKEDQNNPQAIIVFKRPQKISYLCQKAFDNSYGNSKELKALLNSKAYQSIEGFPKENLARVIESRIKQLEPIITS